MIAARIESGIVTEVIVAPSIDWCAACLGGTWIETYTDGRRGKLAGPGDCWDPIADRFASAQVQVPDGYQGPQVP